MKIQVNSDNSVAKDKQLKELVKANVNEALARFGDDITRMEVHLSASPGSGPQASRCLMEARPAGRDPVVVTNYASTLEESLWGAAQKMKRLLSSLFERLGEKA
jgi:hypothetical protein